MSSVGQASTTIESSPATLVLVIEPGVAEPAFEAISPQASLRTLLVDLRSSGPSASEERLHRPGLSVAQGWNEGLASATSEWLCFATGDGATARAALARARMPEARSGVLVLCLGSGEEAPAARGQESPSRDPRFPGPDTTVLFHRPTLLAHGLRFDGHARRGFEQAALVARCLLAAGEQALAWQAADPVPAVAARSNWPEPPAAVWSDKSTYAAVLEHGHLALLNQAHGLHRRVPSWLQNAVLMELQWYFTVDQRERAPTAMVTEAMAAPMHALLGQIMKHIEPAQIDGLDAQGVAPDIRQALHAYHGIEQHSAVVLDAFDHEQGLARLKYFCHGAAPREAFLLDGKALGPSFAKYRARQYFRRSLLSERIVWLAVASGRRLEVSLGGQTQPLRLGPHGTSSTPLAADELLKVARQSFRPGKAGLQVRRTGLPWIKAKVWAALAALASLRPGYRNAWVLMDREIDADDNAEHLYRWVKKHHPEINAWFVLKADSPDWTRLQAEGFRLMAPGLSCRLLYLNADHVISSHVEPALGGFAPAKLGELMRWRFTFLQHGVIKDDMSHWLSNQPFDIFVTTSPGEHASISADGSAYSYTERETRRTGLPRHDSLLALAQAMPANEVNCIMVMPTWRASFASDDDGGNGPGGQVMEAFAASEYAQRWRSLLGSEALRTLVQRLGMRVVFMPHPNAVPFLAAFKLPAHVEVLTKADIRIQKLMCQSAVMITDYSSIAFDMAYLRRPVIYYQFDREQFFGGAHNWREGYFSYDHDGFGPVVTTEQQLLENLANLVEDRRGGQEKYMAQMMQATPERDGQACQRVFDTITKIRAPRAGAPEPKP